VVTTEKVRNLSGVRPVYSGSPPFDRAIRRGRDSHG
jgi:hypothetical protein